MNISIVFVVSANERVVISTGSMMYYRKSDNTKSYQINK